MAQTAHLYGLSMLSAMTGLIDWEGGDATALLVDDSYTPNIDTHQFLDDIVGELSGGGYARVTLTGAAATYNSTEKTVNLDCDPFTFASLTGDYRFIVVAIDTGTDSTSPLIGYVDLGELVSATAQPVDVTPPAEGLFVHEVL